MNDDDDFSQILDQITLPADEELWMDDSFPHYMQQQMTMKYEIWRCGKYLDYPQQTMSFD